MNTKPATTTPAPSPSTTAAVSTTEYERFLAALPESFRKACRSKLDGSGLAANHPVFLVLAELYEDEARNPPRNFIQEATLHADQATQLLNQLSNLPEAIMARIEPQIFGLVSALNDPLQRLEALVTAAQTPEKTPPLPPPESTPTPLPKAPGTPPEKTESKLRRTIGQLFRTAASTVSYPLAWIVTGAISASVAVMMFSIGAAHLARSYEAAYQNRIARMEADSAADTVALNHLLVAGINLKVERSSDREGWYLILSGAHKAAQPVNSPEGLAVEVWP